jgi:hypothetical protein
MDVSFTDLRVESIIELTDCGRMLPKLCLPPTPHRAAQVFCAGTLYLGIFGKDYKSEIIGRYLVINNMVMQILSPYTL